MVGKRSNVRRRGRGKCSQAGSEPKPAHVAVSASRSSHYSWSTANAGTDPSADWVDRMLNDGSFMDYPRIGTGLSAIEGIGDPMCSDISDQLYSPFSPLYGQTCAPDASPGSMPEELQPALSLAGHAGHSPSSALCVCSSSIAALATLMESPASGPDTLLGTLKAQVARLATAAESQSFGRCKACQMLVLVALELMAETYDAIFLGTGGCEVLAGQEPPADMRAMNIRRWSTSPAMKYGSFLIDDSTAAVLWHQVVRSELEKALELVRTVDRQLIGLWPDRYPAFQPLFEDLNTRMAAFIERISDTCSKTRQSSETYGLAGWSWSERQCS